MRSKLLLAKLLRAACLLFPVVCGAQRVVKLTSADHGWLIVPVSINGSGPYAFMLDTGSNRTLIQKELLSNLRISPGRVVPVNMTNGVSYVYQTLANNVTVEGVAVKDLEVEGIDAERIDRVAAHVQGVLGEDFLKHFDILIDNRAKTLTLDGASDLAESLSGEHLPLHFSGVHGGQATIDRPVLDLKLGLGIGAKHFLIDSAANYATYYPLKPPPYQGNARPGAILQTLEGNTRCWVDFITLKVGRYIFPESGIASCDGVTRDKVDVDGALPTNIFDRLFISHSGAYVIVNPRLRKPLYGSQLTSPSGR